MTAEQLAADARSVRIEDEVTRRGIRLQGRGTDRVGPCPVCGGTDRFGVNIKKQMFYCRKCDVGGDVITFVRHVDGCTFKEAVNLLTGGHTPPQKPATGARRGWARQGR
jgi:DNA primase